MDNREALIGRIHSNREKFSAYNKVRLDRLYSSFANPKNIELFEALPFLLTANQPGLPGFIPSGKVVAGIHNYAPTNRALNFIRSRFPQAHVGLPKTDKPFIEMLALMGSGGTIAFNSQSDLDFWVCAHEDRCDPEEIVNFRQKCHAVSQWVDENCNLETHFFLNDIGRVKQNIFDEDEEEGFAGSSLGVLLKEEFLRSSIVVAGKIPFWWAVPGDTSDAAYEKWLALANAGGVMDGFVDLGNLHTIPAEEFVGGALFQILKSLGNPFKSIIKLGLLERYLRGSGGSPFISNSIKKNVQAGKLDIDSIDSYVIMFNDVYDYYGTVANDIHATEILKTCFYLKVDPKLSVTEGKNGTAQPAEKVAKMREFVKKWNWMDSGIDRMDNFENWDINAVNNLWNNTKKFILKGYRDILGNIETRKISHRFTDEELKGISRKIYSHFAVSDNKIDNSLTFKTYPPEKLLTIEFNRSREGKELWTLAKRAIVRNAPVKIIIHSEWSLIAMIVWIGMNRLYQKDFTRMEIATGFHQGDPNFLRDLVIDISTHFSIKKVDIHSGYFLRDPFPVVSYAIINPYTKYAKRVEEIIFLYHNSWGETRFERFTNLNDIALLLGRVLSGGASTEMPFDSAFRLRASYPYGASTEFDRLQVLARDAYSYLVEQKSGRRKRYVTMMQNTYFVYSTAKDGGADDIVCKAYDSEIRLLYALSYNTGVDSGLHIDATVPELSYLRIMEENYRNDCIQIYFQTETKYCYFFVSDERGSLVFFRKSADRFLDSLTRLYVFAKNAVKRVAAANASSPLAGSKKPVEIYHLKREANNHCSITELDPDKDRNIMGYEKGVMPFVLSLHLLENGEMGYRFSLPDGGFSEVYSRGNLHTVSRELQTLSESYRGFSFCPTDVNTEHLGMKLYRDTTSLAITEKNRFELLVEQGLKQGAAPPARQG